MKVDRSFFCDLSDAGQVALGIRADDGAPIELLQWQSIDLAVRDLRAVVAFLESRADGRPARVESYREGGDE